MKYKNKSSNNLIKGKLHSKYLWLVYTARASPFLPSFLAHLLLSPHSFRQRTTQVFVSTLVTRLSNSCVRVYIRAKGNRRRGSGYIVFLGDEYIPVNRSIIDSIKFRRNFKFYSSKFGGSRRWRNREFYFLSFVLIPPSSPSPPLPIRSLVRWSNVIRVIQVEINFDPVTTNY